MNNEAFVMMMKEFIDVSIKDRKINSDRMEKNRDCLMEIKLQLTRLQTQTRLNLKTNEDRHKENNTQHKAIESKLGKIPTDNDRDTYEKRLVDLEKLKPMVWKMTGGLIVVSGLGVAIAKSAGWL